MEQYISKSALVAEIERRRDIFENSDAPVDRLRASAFTSLLSFLDTLEVKEMDLEKEIDLRIGKLHTPLHYEELKDFSKHFFELGLKAAQKGEEL